MEREVGMCLAWDLSLGVRVYRSLWHCRKLCWFVTLRGVLYGGFDGERS